ncbi:MAG: VanW family protein [Clostridia bacterium]|nr:VanW family protein [Clostridia bacterium]
MSSYKHSAPSKSKGGAFLAVAAGLVLVLAVVCFVLMQGGNKIGDVAVLDNVLTDLDRDGLQGAVERIIDQNPITEEIGVFFLSETYTIKAEQIDLVYDADVMAENAWKAGQRSVLERLLGSKEVLPVAQPAVKWDESKLQSVLADAAAQLSRSATTFSYEVNEDATITVTKGGDAVTVTDADIAAALEPRLEKMDYSDIVLPAASGHSEIDFAALKLEIDREPRNPMLDLESDRTGKTILPAERGIEMDIAAAKKAYEASGDNETFTFPVTFIEPTISMEEFQKNLFAHTLSSKTSNFNASLKGRTTNVKLACDFCDNIILNPGDEFSYNGSVGPRTYERGFKDATVYVAGTTEEGVGGGICQVSSTIYTAALHADLEITERYNHSYTVTYVPLGEDATVVYGAKDFRFRNNTDYPIKLDISYGGSSMTVKILGTNLTNKSVKISTTTLSKTPFETVYQLDETLPVDTTKVKNNGYTAYTTESYRIVYENGQQVSKTFENKSVYKRMDKVILENPSSPEKSGNYIAPEGTTPPEGGTTTPVTPSTPATPVTPDPTPATPAPDPVTPAPDVEDALPITPGT